MPLPLTVSRSSKIQIGFTFLVPAYPGCPGKEAVKWLLLLLLLLLVSKVTQSDYRCNSVGFQVRLKASKQAHCNKT